MFSRGGQHYNFLYSLLLVMTIWSVTRFDLCETRIIGKCIKNLEGSRCNMPRSPWQHDSVCIWEGKHRCHIPESRIFKFSLAARLEQKRNILAGDKKPITKLWIKGSGPGLSLDKPVLMQKSARTVGTWQTDISYTYDSNALLCVNSSHCSLNQRALEFRVYRDESGKEGMLGPNFYIPLPLSNSMSGLVGISQPRFTVHPWFDGSIITSHKISLLADGLNIVTGERLNINVTLLRPPSFEYNLRKTYPLVVVFGTQEPKRIRPLLEHMFVHEASIKESIVVSIQYLDKAPFCSFNPFTYDTYELKYSRTWQCKSGKYDCYDCQTCWDSQRVEKCDKKDFISKAHSCLSTVNCVGMADSILDFIEINLLPEIAKRTQNRLQVNFPTQRMSIIGFDGAGLLACYAALSRPLKYENAACMSAPFHWPMTSLKKLANRKLQGIGRLMRELNDSIRITPGLRMQYATQKYYIDIGEHDNFFFPVVDAKEYSQWFIQMLKDVLQLEMNKNIMYSVVPGAGNSYMYYYHRRGSTEVFNRIKTPLLFFLRSEGGPNLDFPRMPTIGLTAFAERKTELEMSQTDLEADDDSTLSSQFNQTTISSTHCSSLRSRRQSPTGVPVSVYLLSISKCVWHCIKLTFLHKFSSAYKITRVIIS